MAAEEREREREREREGGTERSGEQQQTDEQGKRAKLVMQERDAAEEQHLSRLQQVK